MAQIQKGTTYSTGDQVTAANLNALADAAILLPGAITDQTAKTVPLAADTILLHSAADTALRKSTLTQLFSNATGIPLTTGVTGILPAANGGTGVANASTLTLAGNVTHAGAFTQSFTATANTSLTLPTTGTLATLAGSEALSNKTITASPISGSTGAFTTLSASGVASFIGLKAQKATATSGFISAIDEGANVYNVLGSRNNADNAYLPMVIRGTTVTLGATSDIAMISSTGLAVTGALSSTGNADFGTTISSARITLGHVTNATVDNSIVLRAGSTKTAWQIGAQFNVDNGFEITPSTAAGGTTFSTPVAKFTSSGLAVTGQLAVGGATEAASIRTTFTGNTIDGISLKDSADQSNSVFAAFRKSDGTGIGSITRVTTTNAVVYNTTSDGRLKENLRDFTDSGRLIDSLKPRVFDWKNSDENGKNVVGFIAQEEHAADPIFAHIGAVSVGDEDPETITKQWQRSDSALIPILVAELKALRQRVAALEA